MKIREGISRERVLDEIRESVAEDLHRHHLMEKKDLDNVTTAYGLESIRHHGNDQQSILAWIDKWKENFSKINFV
jgi:transketolase N-terminal domain/subunit